MILGKEPLILLQPMPGHAIVIGGAFDAFSRELGNSVDISSVVDGTGAPSGSDWLDASFDFTGLNSMTGLELIVGASTYPIVGLADGVLTVSGGPIAEPVGAYRVSGTVAASLDGSRATATAVDFSRATGQLVVAGGINAGTYQIISGVLSQILVSGILLSLTYSTGLTAQAWITGDQTQWDVAAALVDSAVAVDEIFGQAFDSNAFVVWDSVQPVPTVVISGPKASSLTTLETSRGKYLQDDFGRAIPVQWGESTIMVGLQPIGRDRARVQDQYGMDAQFKGYTEDTIPMTDHTTATPGCLIEADGERYRVIRDEGHRSLLTHTKIYLVRELEQ